MSSPNRVSPEELRRMWALCLKNTPSLQNTKESFEGFIVGFRCYERIAQLNHCQLSDDDVKRVVEKAGGS